MKEGLRKDTQVLPPLWCGNICRNSMNEMCVEHCAIKRDCSYFEPPRDLKLYQLPPFPKTTEMTRAEKFTVVALYLERIVSHLQTSEDEPLAVSNDSRSIKITETPTQQILEVLPNIEDLPLTLKSQVEK